MKQPVNTATPEIGRTDRSPFTRWTRLLGLLAAVITLALRPWTWKRTVREVVIRQIYFTAVEAIPFVLIVALLVGVAVVGQVQTWLDLSGQKRLLGPILGMLLVREVGPALVNFIVIGRSGTAITTEIANMKVRGELDTLNAYGIDPFQFVIFPRVIGMSVSVLCLGVVFVPACLLGGYLWGFLLDFQPTRPLAFLLAVVDSLDLVDLFNFLAKTLVPGLLTGGICCLEGMTAKALAADVPRATTRSVGRCVTALFLISAIVSLFTYL